MPTHDPITTLPTHEVRNQVPPLVDYDVYAGDIVTGKVTSGCLSPTLGRSIAMALITSEHSEPGRELEIDFNGKRNPCKVVKLPFYSRPK